MATVYEDQYTFFIVSPSILLRIKEFQKILQRKWKHILYSVTFFLENRAFCEITWKNIEQQTGHRWQYDTRALQAGYPSLQTQTVCNIIVFPLQQ